MYDPPQPRVALKEHWDNLWKLSRYQQPIKVSWSKRRIVATLKPHLKPESAVLDAGSGSGFFSAYFCSRNMKVTALDYSEEALNLTRRLTHGEATLICDDLVVEGLAERLGSRFDLIFSDGLLEHFAPADQLSIFKNFAAVLNEGGTIATFVPNKWSPWQIIRPLYMPGINECPFTLPQLIQLNERAGLRVFKAHGLNTIPIRFSPDKLFGSQFGMILFTFSGRS
jgi:SAM-dependent methyltransferase